MSFEPEFIRSTLDDKDVLFDAESLREVMGGEATLVDYNEDLRARHSSAPVFDRAIRLQMGFLQTKVEKKELISAWNASQEHLRTLEYEASEQGLLGEVVTLRGQGIEVPDFATDLSNGIAMISIADTKEIDEKSLEKYYYADEVKGIFSGFTLRFVKGHDGDFTPKLAYQVSTEVADIAHAHINLYATGIIGTAQLSFEDDERMDVIGPILERLFYFCDGQEAELNMLLQSLSKPKAHTAGTIRRVAHRAEKIINSLDKETVPYVEDGLIDLITHFIGAHDAYHLRTPLFSMSGGSTTQGAEYYGGEDLHVVSGLASGVVFLAQSEVKDGKVLFYERRTLNLVLKHEDRHIFTPLAKAQEFTGV